MTDRNDPAIEILQLLREETVAVDRVQAALRVAVLGYGDLSDRSEPRQLAGDVLIAVRAALLDEPAVMGAPQLRQVV